MQASVIYLLVCCLFAWDSRSQGFDRTFFCTESPKFISQRNRIVARSLNSVTIKRQKGCHTKKKERNFVFVRAPFLVFNPGSVFCSEKRGQCLVFSSRIAACGRPGLLFLEKCAAHANKRL